jgi:DNA-binding MarR family transcriptional regulator
MTDDALIDALRCTARLIDFALERALRPDLNVPMLVVLRIVARADEVLSMTEVAHGLGCSITNARHLVTRLAVRGYLEIVAYQHAPHRRDVRVTQRGREKLANANVELGMLARKIGQVLQSADTERLAADLERLRDAVRSTSKDRGQPRRIVGLLDPNPWLDGYVVREMKTKERLYGVDRERWEELTFRQRQAQQEAHYYGGTMEEVLARWDLLAKRQVSDGNADSP